LKRSFVNSDEWLAPVRTVYPRASTQGYTKEKELKHIVKNVSVGQTKKKFLILPIYQRSKKGLARSKKLFWSLNLNKLSLHYIPTFPPSIFFFYYAADVQLYGRVKIYTLSYFSFLLSDKSVVCKNSAPCEESSMRDCLFYVIVLFPAGKCYGVVDQSFINVLGCARSIA
jgi:hypothetical protein